MPFANDCLDAGYESLRDVQSLTIDQCTKGTVSFTLIDPAKGVSFDLTQYGISDTDQASSSSGAEFTGARLVLKEMPWSLMKWRDVELTVENAATGELSLTYDEVFSERCGVWTAEVQLWQNGVMVRHIPYFFNINPSLIGAQQHTKATLSIAEIRMTMRDTDPAQNYLLDELDFKENEIMLSVRRCIDYWNEARPPVATGMTPISFPWRYHLSLGVVGQLHLWAAINKMRNDLPYNAGGVTVQQTVKWNQYKQIADELWARWQQWVKEKKYEINVLGVIRTLGSGYYYGFFPR